MDHHKLFKPRANYPVRSDTFSHRIVNQWNALPASVVAAPTVDSFKNRLDKFFGTRKFQL